MANLLTFIQSASKPTERVKRLIEFIDNVDEYRDNMEITAMDDENINIFLKFNPEEEHNKINVLIDDFLDLIEPLERYSFNSDIKKFGLKYSGFYGERTKGLTLYFKKLHQN